MAYEAKADDVEVWSPTPEEWDAYVKAGLDHLGITYEELARQARESDFQSSEARHFWVVVGGPEDVGPAR